MVVMLTAEPNKIYVTKNAGPLYMGKSDTSVVICSDQSILNEQAS
jgi:glucosamine 6-phosphate synthetase-like amidotransferase/phosphosugar isomerase protein